MALPPTTTPDTPKPRDGDRAENRADDRKAKRKAAEDEVLLREIDDAVRQDRYTDFAKNYGRIVIAVLVVGLLAFAAYLYWDSQREAAMEADSEALVGALDQLEAGNLQTADDQLDTLIADGEGLAAINAQMLKAGIAQQDGRSADAAKLYAAVAANGKAPEALRELATVRDVAARFDTMKPADIVATLEPLAKPDRPFFGSAGEMLAMAYLDQDKDAQAGALFASIAKAEDVPESLRSRARQMAGLLGVDAIVDVDEIMEELVVPTDEQSNAPATAQ
ncbi:MAG: tetratricopeptide repeat protein [Parerythrobacter sp.]